MNNPSISQQVNETINQQVNNALVLSQPTDCLCKSIKTANNIEWILGADYIYTDLFVLAVKRSEPCTTSAIKKKKKKKKYIYIYVTVN